MIVDASAFVAILKGEPEEDAFKYALARAPACRMSPVNWLEAAIHAQKAGSSDMRAFEQLCTVVGLIIAPVEAVHMRLALQAWQRYGKGSKHPAKLNLGDCFAYALAKHSGEPLLYKGGDFSRTDVIAAV